jgi:hypothetical protein
MASRRDGELLTPLLGPRRPEVSCEVCFEVLDCCVELELAGGGAKRAFPGVLAHLEGCTACREDYHSLHGLIRIGGKR